MPHLRKKLHLLVVGLVLSLRTDTAKLGFFAWISLHAPKFGKCFKTPKIPAKGKEKGTILVSNIYSQVGQISVHLPAPPACPRLLPHRCLARAEA